MLYNFNKMLSICVLKNRCLQKEIKFVANKFELILPEINKKLFKIIETFQKLDKFQYNFYTPMLFPLSRLPF